MKLLVVVLLLCSCSAGTQALHSRGSELQYSPAAIKTPPKPHELHPESFSVNWGDRKIRSFLANVKLKDSDLDHQKMYGFGPIIEVRTKNSLRILDLREGFPSHCIEGVFHDQWNTRIWILMQECIEGPAAAYIVWISEDGGENWFRGGDLERPSPGFPPSDLFTLIVDGKGNGEAWFKLDASHASPQGANLANGQELIYKSSTKDGGRSWSPSKSPVGINSMLQVSREN